MCISEMRGDSREPPSRVHGSFWQALIGGLYRGCMRVYCSSGLELYPVHPDMKSTNKSFCAVQTRKPAVPYSDLCRVLDLGFEIN